MGKMSVFVLDKDPIKAAEYHVDRHVTRQILETARILEHVCGKFKGWEIFPITQWAHASTANYDWTCKLGLALLEEYTFRWRKTHGTASRILEAVNNPPLDIPEGGLTPFIRSVPEDCLVDDPVLSYRLFYVRHKSAMAFWKNREVPKWWIKLAISESAKANRRKDR